MDAILWFLCIVFMFLIWPVILLYGILHTPKYKKRYAKCVEAVDEAVLDVLKAVRIIMEDADPAQIDATVVEAIMVNFIVQRTFTQNGVLYWKETSPEWIQTRLDIVKAAQVK